MKKHGAQVTVNLNDIALGGLGGPRSWLLTVVDANMNKANRHSIHMDSALVAAIFFTDNCYQAAFTADHKVSSPGC
jgi:hypothetical protein